MRKIHLHFEDTDNGGLRCAILDENRNLPISAMSLKLVFDCKKSLIKGQMRWLKLVSNEDGCIESPEPDYFVNEEGQLETTLDDVVLSKVTSTNIEIANKTGDLVRNLCKIDAPDRFNMRGFDMSGD